MICRSEMESMLSMADTAACYLDTYLIKQGLDPIEASRITRELSDAVHQAEEAIESRLAGYGREED